MRLVLYVLLCFVLCGCNSVYLKPHTLDTNSPIFTQRGGYSMKRSVKQTMEERGYTVTLGSLQKVKEVNLTETEEFLVPSNVRYTVRVTERKEILRPIWCMFNGFWWWNFSVSIVDRKNKNEILSWRGRGCANSSLRKLNDILDELEMPTNETKTAKHTENRKNLTDYEVLSESLDDEND